MRIVATVLGRIVETYDTIEEISESLGVALVILCGTLFVFALWQGMGWLTGGR